jgi:hypothetical protein
METPLNEIRIDCRGNPKLREYFARKEDGHECTTSIRFKKTTMTADGILIGVMNKIEPEGYEETGGSDGGKPRDEVEPDASEPVNVLIDSTKKAEKTEPEAAYV